MGINKQSDIEANLQIGPTDIGMVRIYVSAGQTEIPMDFDPEEAEEIAEEIKLAAKLLGNFQKKLATLLSDQYTQPIYYMQY